MPSPAHDAVVAMLQAASAGQPATPPTIPATRQSMDALGATSPVPPEVTVAPITLGGVPAERITPPDPSDVTVLYLHGGAYVAGSLASHRSLGGRLAVATGAVLAPIAYRLAPEHPHPAAVEDAVAAHRALVAEGRDPRRIVVAGDSAGGGLAVATLLALAAAGDPLPAGGVLLSPWLDLTLAAPSITTVADPLLRADVLASSAAAYAGTDLTDPSVSPALAPADRLATLPPLLVLAGTGDMLVDDSRVLAGRARAAGVTVELVVEEGLIHAWPLFADLPESTEALARVAAWIAGRTA